MSGVSQVVFMNQRSFIEPAPTVIGQPYGGGFWAGQISTSANGVATHNLVVGPKSSAETSRAWKTSTTSSSGTSSFINGPTNTANMNNASHPAALFCAGRTIGGFTDWYMPALNELEVCYFNLKPTTDSNNTSSGTNTNAVPSRGSNYTSGTPAQTSATDFQTGNSQAFNSSSYWSSTEDGAAAAWWQRFNTGQQQNDRVKTYSTNVRAIRRVPV
jgi:hypothetical protein